MGFIDALEAWMQTPTEALALAACFLLCLLTAGFFIDALAKKLKHKWESGYYLFLCAGFLAWGICGLAKTWAPGSGAIPFFEALRITAHVFIPAFLCLHVWKQVYFKHINPGTLILYLSLPAFVSVMHFATIAYPSVAGPTLLLGIGWMDILLLASILFSLVRSYLLCLNVFYQMPRHMRKSTIYLLLGITACLLFCFGRLWFKTPFILTWLALFAIAALGFLYHAFSVTFSRNVIATSRDFVFSTLPALVLVLSQKNRILDWNHKSPATLSPFPQPGYLEDFGKYKNRILADCKGRISPHGENIITLDRGGELHYSIDLHDVAYKGELYGRMAVISEITNIYSTFRHLENIAMYDQLTGLHSRNSYMNTVLQIAQPENMPLVIIVGDVNGLKPLNDTKGHLAGDALLATVAQHIKAALPQGAYAARIGGDEFAILMPAQSLEAADRFTEAVNAACATVHDELYGTPSISWGAVVMESADEDYNAAFERADAIMYNQKRAGFVFRSSGLVPGAQPSPEDSGAQGMP